MQTKHMLAMGVGTGLMVGFILALLSFMLPGMPRTAAGAPIRNVHMQAGAPGLISYQGLLSDANSQPYTGTASLAFAIYESSSGGSPLWQESQNSVSVGAGYFTVQLGSVTPLTAAIFDGPTRYLQVSVNTGSGPETLPRQRLTAVPYAFQAETAASAASADAAPWDGLTGVPSGFADGIDDSGASYENVIVVAKSGGDYTSVAAALNSISSPSSSNRYLVWVAPGVYNETDLLEVREYVHLQGAGPNATVVTSSRTHTVQNSDAATARLYDNGRISDMTVANEGNSSTYAIAIWSAEASREASIDNVVVEVLATGGVAHYALYMADSEPTIRNSKLKAGGASTVNTAFGSVNSSGGFPQALIESSTLIGGSNNIDGVSCNDPSGTGYGLQMTNSAPTIRDSYICGGHRAIFAGVNGSTLVEGSQIAVSSTSGAFMIETSGSGSVQIATSEVSYLNNKFTGVGELRCIHNFKPNRTPASDGITSTTACN